MEVKQGLYYSKEHEWVRVEGDQAYIGITDYAQDSLGSIVYVELPQEGKAISRDDVLGVVESVKAASDIFSPISGKVVEANEALLDSPELLNGNPYDNYIVVLSIDNQDELKELLSPEQYDEYTKGE
ncbi:MAG: glycine cleavage system protein GcvH [Acetivibrionales bacterium]|jgi:glycine cleavage system H protein|nr:glycine cleavage system protein GcvH [Clostridiaceae bacterium]